MGVGVFAGRLSETRSETRRDGMDEILLQIKAHYSESVNVKTNMRLYKNTERRERGCWAWMRELYTASRKCIVLW